MIMGNITFSSVPHEARLDELVASSADESNLIPVTENLQLLSNLGLYVLVFRVEPLEFLFA